MVEVSRVVNLENAQQGENHVKTAKKTDNFARMCRPQQVNMKTKTTDSSEEECNLIQTFDSCDEFEILLVEVSQPNGSDRKIYPK